MKAKIIRVTVEQKEALLICKSRDLPGLTVPVRSEADIASKCLGAIKEMLDYGVGSWRVTEAENPEAVGARYAFVAVLDHKDDEIERLEREVRYLRHYGNSAATHMADEAMARGEMESS